MKEEQADDVAQQTERADDHDKHRTLHLCGRSERARRIRDAPVTLNSRSIASMKMVKHSA